MTQVTVRRVEEDWVAKAKAEAAKRGVSMNTVLLEALAKGLGVNGEKKTNGLEKFAGSRPEGFGPEFDEAMKECSQIDEEMWK
ncbi:hypothetical protein JIN77_00925 [Verrucomicrobiaceae bacterium R5-34]|nr:hypothetical protein [Verrucomicrobiaceae bacterium R5-34]